MFLLLSSHLFPLDLVGSFHDEHVVMIEDYELCTRFRYHQQKLAFVLDAMRNYRDLLRKKGFSLDYVELKIAQKNGSFRERLEHILGQHKAKALTSFAVEDRFVREQIATACATHSIDWIVVESPMFLNSDQALLELIPDRKPFMKTFYEHERTHRHILMTDQGPLGGKFSFDSDNRKKLPDRVHVPDVPVIEKSPYRDQVVQLVREFFSDHPGELEQTWLPVTHDEARRWLLDFIHKRLQEFGPYEDALSPHHPFVFHSVLSPLMNIGLLTPRQVIDEVLAAYQKKNIPLCSVEGFIRQIIGWREFIKGIDEKFGPQQHESNFFNHQRKLTKAWYEGTLGIPPLDDAIKKARTYGYCHHIERLMVISNTMLLSELHPHEVYRWFMEMFVDSADWVMGPNVFGMGQFSDGGIFATKPYICGSNYLLKMSSYKKGEWCDVVDGLYWRFIDKHRDFFHHQPRLNMVSKTLDRMASDRRDRLFSKAQAFIETFTRE